MGASTMLVTVQEFLEKPETEGVIEELIGGEVIGMPVSGQPHEVTKSNVNRVLTAWSLQNPARRLHLLNSRHQPACVRSNRAREHGSVSEASGTRHRSRVVGEGRAH